MGACFGKNDLGSRIPRNPAIDCTPLRDSKVPIIFIAGGPGSGKQTLAKKIIRKYGFTLINTSDLLRAEASTGTERGDIIQQIMKEGQNIPADVVVQLVEEKMVASPSTAGFVILGFPRDKKQATLFAKDISAPSLVLYQQVKKTTMEDRMRERAAANARFDDTPEIIDLRIRNFLKNAGALASAFKSVTTKIDAELGDEEVFEAACSAIRTMMAKE